MSSPPILSKAGLRCRMSRKCSAMPSWKPGWQRWTSKNTIKSIVREVKENKLCTFIAILVCIVHKLWSEGIAPSTRIYPQSQPENTGKSVPGNRLAQAPRLPALRATRENAQECRRTQRASGEVLYFHHKKKLYLCTSGYTKKTDKTDEQEVQRALRIRNDFLQEYGVWKWKYTTTMKCWKKSSKTLNQEGIRKPPVRVRACQNWVDKQEELIKKH